MHRRFMPLFNGLIWATLPSGVPVTAAVAATGNCAALGPMPAMLVVGEGQQQEVQSPVPITRIAVGDPKIADVRVNGNQSFLLTDMAANAQLPSLPGEKLRNYDPNWYRLYFLENGDFDQRSGLSQ